MIVDFDSLSGGNVYHAVTQSLIPRPIAWVLTDNNTSAKACEKSFNLAPFSYFTAVSSSPALLMISVGKKSDGSDKDSLVNIVNNQQAVVHIASTANLDKLNATAIELPHGESELSHEAIELADFAGFALPRVSDAPVAFACELYDVQQMKDSPQQLIFLQIKQLYISDEAASIDVKGRLSIDAVKVDAIARLGASEYITSGEVLKRRRP